MRLPPGKPSFVTTVTALRTTDTRFPWVGPTDEESEVADVLEELQALHVGPDDEPDDNDHYGDCAGCREPWPCKAWLYGEGLAVQWIGRAQDRVWTYNLAARAHYAGRPAPPDYSPSLRHLPVVARFCPCRHQPTAAACVAAGCSCHAETSAA